MSSEQSIPYMKQTGLSLERAGRRVTRNVCWRSLAAALLVGSAALSGCGSSELSTDARIDRGDRAFDMQRFDEAQTEYAAAAHRSPGRWEAQYKRGLTLMQLDRLSEARRSLEVAWTQVPLHPDVADALAEVMYRQNDASRLHEFLAEQSGRTGASRDYLRVAKYARLMDDPDSARTAYETAVVLDDGKSADVYLEMASFLESLGRLDEAVRRLRQAYGLAPDDDRVHERLRALGEVPGPTIALPPGR